MESGKGEKKGREREREGPPPALPSQIPGSALFSAVVNFLLLITAVGRFDSQAMSCSQDESRSDNAASALLVGTVSDVQLYNALPRPRVPARFASADNARQRNRRLNSRIAAHQAAWRH